MLSHNSDFSPEERELVDALEAGRLSRRTFLRYAAGSSAALVVAGTSSTALAKGPVAAAAAARAKRGGTLHYMLSDQALTLDPAFSTQFSERPVMMCIYDKLIDYDANFNIKPGLGLARSWKVLEGGRQLLLELYPGIKFQDGTDCDAHAVKWNLDRFLNKKLNSPMAGLIVPPLVGVKAEGRTEVRLLLSKPWRPLLAALADRPGYIVSPTAAMKYGKNFGNHPVGTGPFKFESWVHNGNITLKRFAGYWRKGLPYLDEIVCVPVMDSAVANTALESNGIQVLQDVSLSLLEELAHNNNIVINKIRGGHWYALTNDVNKPPFNNAALSQAIMYGSNRQAAIKLAFAGHGVVPNSLIVTGFAAPPQSAEGPYIYSQTRAKAAMRRAGSAAKGALDLTTATDYALYSNIAQALQPGWKTAGLNVSLQGGEYATNFPNEQSGKVNWGQTDWTPRADPDGLLRLLFYSSSSDNTTRFRSSQVDHWLDEAAKMYNVKKAKQIYEKILDVVNTKGGFNLIAMPPQVGAVRSNIGGYVQYPDDLTRLSRLYYKQ